MATTQVFLSYAREDRDHAVRLRRSLARAGVAVWFDETDLLGGEEWAAATRQAIRKSRYFIALLSSRSVNKRGFVQREIREALDVLDTHSPNEIYLIPVRIDDCSPAYERLKSVQYVDLFRGWKAGIDRLLRRFAPERRGHVHHDGPPKLRTDGLYFVRTEGAYKYHYLRFLRGGTVLAVSSSLTPTQMAPWMKPGNPHLAVGRYAITESQAHSRVRFVTRSTNGVVEYQASILRGTLILRKHSQINGHRDVHEYRFQRLKTVREDADAQPNERIQPTARRARRG